MSFVEDAIRILQAGSFDGGNGFGTLQLYYTPSKDTMDLAEYPWRLHFFLVRMTKGGRPARKGYFAYGFSPEACVRKALETVQDHAEEIKRVHEHRRDHG